MKNFSNFVYTRLFFHSFVQFLCFFSLKSYKFNNFSNYRLNLLTNQKKCGRIISDKNGISVYHIVTKNFSYIGGSLLWQT